MEIVSSGNVSWSNDRSSGVTGCADAFSGGREASVIKADSSAISFFAEDFSAGRFPAEECFFVLLAPGSEADEAPFFGAVIPVFGEAFLTAILRLWDAEVLFTTGLVTGGFFPRPCFSTAISGTALSSASGTIMVFGLTTGGFLPVLLFATGLIAAGFLLGISPPFPARLTGIFFFSAFPDEVDFSFGKESFIPGFAEEMNLT
jgi:hypothetical protein